jgi:hypothetical protein
MGIIWEYFLGFGSEKSFEQFSCLARSAIIGHILACRIMNITSQASLFAELDFFSLCDSIDYQVL